MHQTRQESLNVNLKKIRTVIIRRFRQRGNFRISRRTEPTLVKHNRSQFIQFIQAFLKNALILRRCAQELLLNFISFCLNKRKQFGVHKFRKTNQRGLSHANVLFKFFCRQKGNLNAPFLRDFCCVLGIKDFQGLKDFFFGPVFD